MPESDHTPLLTADALAERLGVRPETVLRWRRHGRIPARMLSHKVIRFDLADVLASLEARQKQAGRGVGR